MICVSIAQESRRFALVDLHNAAPQCDLIELRLDRFAKAPDLAELLETKPRPVIVSCRRVQDGGAWQGSEQERLALLRHAVVHKPDYVEIEVDVADQLRPFPPTKRVVSYTNLRETPEDLAEIYGRACSKRADVVKLASLVRSPEEAWPLVQILAHPALPTVAVGLGRAGAMLGVLARKVGAPWAYAALERGMETYPGQPTVADLETVYDYRAIGRRTRFVGVAGSGPLQRVTTAGVNAAMRRLELPIRCLPLEVGGLSMFQRVIDATRLDAIIVLRPQRQRLLVLATKSEAAAARARAVDLLVRRAAGGWRAYNLLARAAVMFLEDALAARSPGDKPLAGRPAMVVGSSPDARSLAWALKAKGAVLILAGRDKDASRDIARELECRFIPLEAIYTTLHEILVVCDDVDDPADRPKAGIHPGHLKPSMAVMDLTNMPLRTDFLREAEARGCLTVSPRDVLVGQLALQVRLVADKEADPKALEEAVAAHVEEE